MIRALSTAATGMEAQQTRLDVTANNMANVSTTGFKKSRSEFQDLMYQTLRAPGGATGTNSVNPTGVQVGMGVRTVATQRMHEQGMPVQTGNALDVAIEGPGFFRLTMPTGDWAYTRDGSFKRDMGGRLVNADGYPLDSDIQIPPDAETIVIAADGLVTAKMPGSTTPVELGQIELTNFANPAGLSANGRNLYFETASSGNPIAGQPGSEGVGTLAQNQLESSNVQIVEEMIDLISGQRAYEINSRVIRAADEMLQQTANLK